MNPATATTATKLRAVRLEVTESTHTLLRLEAARQDKPLSELARIAVEDYLRRSATRQETRR
jgi:hypothetical protein